MLRYVPQPRDDETPLRQAIIRLAAQYGRYGYRQITGLLWQEGWDVSRSRVERIWKLEGLRVPQKQPKRGRLWLADGSCIRLRPERRNHVWSWDFVMDQTESGGAFRILTLIDEHTRQCLATHVAWSIRAQDVLTVLEQVMRKHGTPEHIRSDNGPEFVAYAIQDWLAAKQIKTLYIKPGSPWENAYIESFHDKLRDECLNREVFGTLAEARVIINAWRHEYNECRPHSSLGYRTPAEAAARCQTSLRPHLATLDETSATFDSATEPPHINNSPRTPKLHW